MILNNQLKTILDYNVESTLDSVTDRLMYIANWQEVMIKTVNYFINNTLDFSYMKKNKFKMKVEEFDIREAIKDVI